MPWWTQKLPTLVGIHHVGYTGAITDDEVDGRTVQMLARALNIRNVIAFVGSGLSRAYGQPDWDTFARKLVDATLERVRRVGPKGKYISEQEEALLEQFQKGSAPAPAGRNLLSRSDRNVLLLDLCEEIYDRVPGAAIQHETGAAGETLQKAAAKLIRETDERPIPPTRDPLRQLIQNLGIRRFLTTNYDDEIEAAFTRTLNLSCRSFPPAPPSEAEQDAIAAGLTGWSLSLAPEQLDAVARFAVAAPGFEYGVFHLHGRKSADASMLLTERDYQRLYLFDDPMHRAYREILEVVFGGNAILFVGIGMQEADLLRPLRQFVTERSGGGHERPLFALLRKPRNELEALEFRRYLYARYGVKVLYYEVEDGDLQKETEIVTERLGDVVTKWQEWWTGWRREPAPRPPNFYRSQEDPNGMLRHFVKLSDRKEWLTGSRDLERVRGELSKSAQGKALVVLGAPGTGKGTLGQELVSITKGEYSKRFFATAHFTNDIQSIIEGAASHFAGTDQPVAGDAFEKLETELSADRQLLVIGGIERLLRWGDPVHVDSNAKIAGDVAVASGADASRLFQLVRNASTSGRSDVVLTSTRLPTELKDGTVATIKVKGVQPDSMGEISVFADVLEAVRSLRDALDGHTYALSVITRALKERSDGEAFLRGLLMRVTAIDAQGRPATAVAEVWQDFLRRHETQRGELRGELTAILQHVALFTTPVTPKTLCKSGSCGTHPDGKGKAFAALEANIDLLEKAGFLIAIERHAHPGEIRVTAHTLVRNLVLRQLGCEPDAPGAAQRFELSGWSADVPEMMPGTTEGHALVTRSIDRLLDEAERLTRLTAADSPAGAATSKADDADRDGTSRRDMVRGAYAILRSRFSATAVPRLGVFAAEEAWRLPWPHYDAYQRRLSRVLNQLRADRQVEAYYHDRNRDGRTPDVRTLYKDEIAWLYNELALVAFSQGLMADAYALYMASAKASEVVEPTPGLRCAEAALGLGLVLLERGQLTRVRDHLNRAANYVENDTQFAARVQGHIGLVDHLTGDYTAAERRYDNAIDTLHRTGNLRGESIFLRHRSDLHRKQRDYKRARTDIERSIAAAHAGRHADLLHHARVADAVLMLAEERTVGVETLTPVRDFANRVGMKKLDWDARIVQSQIALKDGDVELAGRLAVQCLRIAAANGLRLRLTGSLIMLGRVSWDRGNSEAGEQLVRSAQALAERQKNQLLYEKGERLLMESGHSRPDPLRARRIAPRPD